MPLQTLIDPLFSKKIHEVKVVTKSEQDLVAKIEELYASLEKNLPMIVTFILSIFPLTY